MKNHVTEEEWFAKARELFGENQDNWTFVCPACGHEMSIVKARTQYPEHLPKMRQSDLKIECECIGRAVPGLGCDWCAYGLFNGPVFVKRQNGNETPCFDFAGKPFTGDAGRGNAT